MSLWATFLGHQSWVLETGRARLLVDPLLGDSMGVGAPAPVWPPRRIDVGAMPPVDAVYLSHEHEDHFDVASLHLLERDIPIVLSRRSSSAARTILAEMGFRVELMDAGDQLLIGDLALTLFSPDNVGSPVADEWDVLPYLVSDTEGPDRFFSAVDVVMTPAGLDALARRTAEIGLISYTNNVVSMGFQRQGSSVVDLTTQALLLAWLDLHGQVRARFGAPAAVLSSGGGYGFGGELSWLNEVAFTADSEAALAMLEQLHPESRFLATRPGDRICAARGGGERITHERAPFVTLEPRERWPAHGGRQPVPDAPDFGPATGRAALAPGELTQLAAELDRFATFVAGRPLSRELAHLHPAALDGREPTFTLIARDRSARHAFRYQPEARRFAPDRSADPRREVVLWGECWATDLLALLRLEVSQATLHLGRLRTANHASTGLSEDLSFLLWCYAHPLHRPERALATYRRTLAELVTPPARVRAGRQPLHRR